MRACERLATYLYVGETGGNPRLCDKHARDMLRVVGLFNYVPLPPSILRKGYLCGVDMDTWGPSPAPYNHGRQERDAIVEFMKAEHAAGATLESVISKVETGWHIEKPESLERPQQKKV